MQYTIPFLRALKIYQKSDCKLVFSYQFMSLQVPEVGGGLCSTDNILAATVTTSTQKSWPQAMYAEC